MELFTRTFTSQSVAVATDVEPKAIQNWVWRGLINGHRDAEGKGHRVKFTWFNIMEIALATELVELGISIQDAFAAAQRFAHVSSGSTTSDGDGDPFRSPALPWHHERGTTFLFLWNGGCVVRLLDDHGQVNLAQVAPYPSRKTAYVALDVSEIFSRVCTRMNLHPLEVLDEAYSKKAKD